MSFQKIVVAILLIILIIFLVIIGVTLYNAKYKDIVYPPKTAQCPDYWTLDSSNNCVNTKALGNSTCSTSINLNQTAWNGPNSNCNKYQWAKACNLTWDGITNVNLECNN
jgi:hypothetical protein